MEKRDFNKKNNKKISAKNLIKLLVVCFFIYAVITWVKQGISLSQAHDLEKEYQDKIAAAKIEQQMLEDELEKAGTDEYVERIAREKLGLVKANERVFIDINQK